MLSGKPKENLWTEDEINFLRENRFLSTREIANALGRTVGSVKEKRCRLKLSQLAKCENCGKVFKRINQHSQCEECTPDQRGYAANYRNSLNGRWQMYKSNAKKLGIPFEITISDMAEFWQKSCYYCGGEIETVGLDRVDNTSSYVRDNVVPCCGRCNEMKNNSSVDEWVGHMKKILKYMGV